MVGVLIKTGRRLPFLFFDATISTGVRQQPLLAFFFPSQSLPNSKVSAVSKTISKSVGNRGINLRNDVITVQTLINNNIGKLVPLKPLSVDGKVGKMTIGAIEEFQRRVVKMTRADGRVDPNGKTLAALNAGSAPVKKPPTSGTFKVTFSHGGKVPDVVKGAAGTDGLYESKVSVSGPKSGTFRGSIFPNDMSVKGRIKDGTYPLYIGFHKRGGGSETPKASDLMVRSNGFRATLIVNNDQSVPVTSDNASKTTSSAIHVHNGYRSKRESDGCQTLHPDDWSKFIQIFLDAYPSLSEWTSTNKYVGKKIGDLIVKS